MRVKRNLIRQKIKKNYVFQQVIKECSSLTVAESSESPWSDDILWVLTVPAIWSDQAKQFMREAAIQVCITFFVVFYDIIC